jgi:hypothetical protein
VLCLSHFEATHEDERGGAGANGDKRRSAAEPVPGGACGVRLVGAARELSLGKCALGGRESWSFVHHDARVEGARV